MPLRPSSSSATPAAVALSTNHRSARNSSGRVPGVVARKVKVLVAVVAGSSGGEVPDGERSEEEERDSSDDSSSDSSDRRRRRVVLRIEKGTGG